MSNSVTVTVPVAYHAWAIPEEAYLVLPPRPRSDGMRTGHGVPLDQLDPKALDALAAQWLAHLYAAVGRKSPFAMAVSA